MVYRADQDTDGVWELYSAPIAGGSFVKLSGSMPSYGDALQFRFSPDSQYVLYTADQETDGLRELYSVPLTGGTPVKLNGPVTGNMYFSSISISPNSQRVVFVAHYEAVSGHHLYSVPIDGGTRVMLSEERSYPVIVRPGFLITPDSSRVVYRADQQTEDVDELYSVPITGGTPTKLNGSINSIGGDVKPGFQLTSDGSRVLYLADLEEAAMIDLYSVPIAGGGPVRLNHTLSVSWAVERFEISADDQWVVYEFDGDVHDLYSVPVAGGTQTRLMDAPTSGGWAIIPDSSRVAWMAEFTLPSWVELYSVPITGGSPTTLNGPLTPLLGNVHDFEFLPEGSGVIYHADQFDTVNELYASLFVPGADLRMRKRVTPAESIVPGEPLTYTLTFSNTGQLTATGVVVTDTVPPALSDLSFQTSDAVLEQTGSVPDYRWRVSDLATGQGGVITITGVVSPTLRPGTIITNTATIGGDAPEDEYERNRSTVTVIAADKHIVYLPLVLRQ